MSSFKRIKVGHYTLTLSSIVYAHKNSDEEVAIRLFSNAPGSIDDVILREDEALTFWSYCSRWEKTIFVEGCFVNVDHITLVRPDVAVNDKVLIWLTIDDASPFIFEGRQAREFWEAYTHPKDCLDLKDYEPSRSNLPSFKKPRESTTSKS